MSLLDEGIVARIARLEQLRAPFIVSREGE
jgi:hypothetical protein